MKAVEAVRNNQYAYGDMPDSSNAHFFAAEKRMQELYTQSISLAALSTITNDYVLPYDGEDFEKVLVNVFLALNYVEKGEPDEALVEARKVDLKLRQYGRDYQGKNPYQDDAFIYLKSGGRALMNNEVANFLGSIAVDPRSQ